MRKISRKLNIVISVLLIAAFVVPFFSPLIPAKAQENNRTVVVGYFYDDNPDYLDGFSDTDRKSGFAYEYIREVAKITGWEYEYVYGTWNEIYEMLCDGTIDMMPGVAYLESREEQVLYSNLEIPLLNRSFSIFAAEDSKINPNYISSLNGMRIAVRSNSIQYKLLRDYIKANGLDMRIVAMNSENACLNAVEAGEAMAFVSSNINEHGDYKAYINIGAADCYVAFAKGRESMRDEWNSAVGVIYSDEPYYGLKLEEKYFRVGNAGKTLTSTDRAWLKEKGSLKVGITRNDLPLSSIDDGGNVIGLAQVIVDELIYFLGIPVEVVAFDSTAMMEKAIVDSEIDIGFPMFCDLWYSEKNGYLLTDPIFSDRALLVYKGEFTEDKRETVAIGMSAVSQRFIVNRDYSSAEIKLYASRKEYMDAVLNGEAGFTVGSSSVLNRYIEENEKYQDLKTTILSTEIEFGMAVSPECHALVHILNKAIRNIDDTDITNAMIKYSVVEKKITFRSYVKENTLSLMLALMVFFSVVAILVLVIRDRFKAHKNTIASQEKRLDETQANLEEALENEIKAKTDLARALEDRNVIYSELLRLESGGVIAVDWETRKFVTVNEAALKILGFDKEEDALQQDVSSLVDFIIEDVREEKRQALLKDLNEKGISIFEAPVLLDGDIKYYLVQAAMKELKNGQKVCLGSLTDITEAKELEIELQTASQIDALSSVYNRGWGEKLVDDAMRSGHGGMFCLLDINKFKTINDSFGHQCGDEAIKAVALGLKESFRDEDIVLRLGGDEFAVYAIGVHSKEEGAEIINRFFGRLAKKRIPEMGDRRINVALGACICSDGNRLTFDDAYRMADSQMYKCKEKAESSFIFF